MKIDKTQKPAVTETMISKPATIDAQQGPKSTAPQVKTSADYDFAKAGKEAISALATPDSAKVEELKTAVANGEFDVNVEALARDLAKYFFRSN